MSAFTIIHGCDVGEVPPTPASPHGLDNVTPESHRSLRMTADLYGRPLAYAHEQGGAMIQHILPTPGLETEQVSGSSKVRLAMHTETSFHTHRPSHVLLLCLRGDPNAITTVSCCFEALKRLRPHQQAVLQAGSYVTGVDQSFLTDGATDFERPHQIVRHVDGRTEFAYDEVLTRGLDQESQMALDAFTDACHDVAEDVVLATGDMLVIDNRATVHGRKAFLPRYDGTDRWLQRMMVFDYSIDDAVVVDGIITERV